MAAPGREHHLIPGYSIIVPPLFNMELRILRGLQGALGKRGSHFKTHVSACVIDLSSVY